MGGTQRGLCIRGVEITRLIPEAGRVWGTAHTVAQ